MVACFRFPAATSVESSSDPRLQPEPSSPQQFIESQLLKTQQSILDAIRQERPVFLSWNPVVQVPPAVRPVSDVFRPVLKTAVVLDERVKSAEPKTIIPYNIVFITHSFYCESLNSCRLCISTTEKSCVLIKHSGRVSDFIDVRRFASEPSILTAQD